MEASSDKMSPNMLPVRMTSNWRGFRISCIAALSTYMWDKDMSSAWFSLTWSVTTDLHN